jgi:hypothetical protein
MSARYDHSGPVALGEVVQSEHCADGEFSIRLEGFRPIVLIAVKTLGAFLWADRHDLTSVEPVVGCRRQQLIVGDRSQQRMQEYMVNPGAAMGSETAEPFCCGPVEGLKVLLVATRSGLGAIESGREIFNDLMDSLRGNHVPHDDPTIGIQHGEHLRERSVGVESDECRHVCSPCARNLYAFGGEKLHE